MGVGVSMRVWVGVGLLGAVSRFAVAINRQARQAGQAEQVDWKGMSVAL